MAARLLVILHELSRLHLLTLQSSVSISCSMNSNGKNILLHHKSLFSNFLINKFFCAELYALFLTVWFRHVPWLHNYSICIICYFTSFT